MKRMRYMISALLLCLSIGVGAENIVTLSSTEGAPGDEVTVSIALQNSDVLSSLQVSIPLDENLTLVNGSAQKSERCAEDHQLTVGVKDGELNIFIYSYSMAAISGNSGEVASFKLKLGKEPTTVNLTPSKTTLANTSGTTVESESVGGSVTTRCAKAQYSTMEVDFGAVPIHDTYQQTVTVTNVGNDDLVITDLIFSDIMRFSTSTSPPLNIAAGGSAQLNVTYAPEERGNITKSLKVTCNSTSKLNTIQLKAQPFAVNELHVQPVSGISDEEVTISMTMNNMDPITGFQIEFTLPEELEYVANSFTLSDRKQDHAAVAQLNGNVLRILTYSGNNEPYTGNDGEIGSFKVKLVGRNGLTLTPTKTVLSTSIIDGSPSDVTSAVYGGQVTISSPRISTNNSLAFGAVSVTDDCEKSFTIRNYGSVPLTISRIVFSNENLSVKEAMPMVIPANSNSNVTVVYGSVEQADFSGTMQIYSNDPDLRLREVSVTGNRFAPNYVSVQADDVFDGENLKINVSTNNYDAITGLQFDVEYPGQYFETFSNNVTPTDRATGMNSTIIQDENNPNLLHVFCYFLGGGGIEEGNGKVVTIQLRKKVENVPENSYNLCLTNIKMGTSDMENKYAGTDLQTDFTVINGLRGDVNGDGKVNVADFISVANYILGNVSATFVEKAADVNEDGKINVADFIGIANIILQGNNIASSSSLMLAAPRKFDIDIEAFKSGEEIAIRESQVVK